jgi:hypothetical protein
MLELSDLSKHSDLFRKECLKGSSPFVWITASSVNNLPDPCPKVQISNSKIALVAFANSESRWSKALKRLGREAHKSGFFDYVFLMSENELRTLLSDQDLNFIETHSTGYGYWIWKPYLILNAFASNSDLDIVVYLDSGCQLNWKKKATIRFRNYISLVRDQGFLAFQLPNIERFWTDANMLRELNIDESVSDSGQIAGGVLMFRRDIGVNLCQKWLQLMQEGDHKYLLGSGQSELDGSLVQHRHDQSILSLIVKSQSSLTFIPGEEIEFEYYDEKTSDYPIWAARNPSQIRVGTNSLVGKALRKFGL